MLRLVHPPSGGNGTDPPRPKGARSAALSLSSEEVRRVRAALTNASLAYGGVDVLASVMGVPPASLYRVKCRRPSGTLAIRLAAAARVPVEVMLSGKLAVARRAPAPRGGAA